MGRCQFPGSVCGIVLVPGECVWDSVSSQGVCVG